MFLSYVPSYFILFLIKYGITAVHSKDSLPNVGLQWDEIKIRRAFTHQMHPRAHQRHPRSDSNKYAVFIDAGSSGSRIWVYTWSTTAYDSLGIPDVRSLGNHKKGRGISVQTESEIRETLKELVDFAKTNVEEELHADTPIYLFATAGLRTLAEGNANRIIEFAYETLQDKSVCPFKVYGRDSVRILSGEEEGVFMWLAVNYLGETLKPTKAGTKDETIGIIELGGASTQLAFIPSGILLANKFALDISDQRYSLYVHSYLDFGQELVLAWIQNYLEDKNPGQTTISNPCMLTGQETSDKSKTFTGASDPTRCIAILEELVYKADPSRCHPKPCAIGSIYQPTIPAEKTFYALGAFATVLKNVRAATPDQPANFTTVRQKGIEFCSKTKDEIPGAYPKVSEEFITKSCVTTLYFNVLLTKGYGFNPNSNKVFIKDEVNGKDADWTLGALLYERFTHPGFKPPAAAASLYSSADKINSPIHLLTIAIYLCATIVLRG